MKKTSPQRREVRRGKSKLDKLEKLEAHDYNLCGLCVSAANLFAFFALLLAGCAVGPDFKRPEPPAVTRYDHEQTPAQTAAAVGQAQRFDMGAEIAEDWWRLFNCAELEAVVRKALDENRTLQSALLRLRQSQENLRAGYGVFFPQINGSFSAARQTFSPVLFGISGQSSSPGLSSALGQSSLFNLYTLQGTVSYVVDAFGGERRHVEDLQAQVEYWKQTARAAALTLVSNVVNASIAGAGYGAQIESTGKIIEFQKKQLEITENQAKAGTVPYSNVLAIRAQLETTEAALPQIQKNLSQSRHLLTALVGRLPEQWAPPTLDLTSFTLPVEIPVGVPSELTRRRPDILAAEAQLHSASANIGAATAALFPSLTLSGSYGQSSTDISKLFAPGANVWMLGSSLTQPIFHGGALWFQRRAAIEAYKASLSDYQQTVAAGFQQVADCLRALEFDANAIEVQSESLATAARNLELINSNHKAGLVNYLQVLSANTQCEQARLGFIQAQAMRLQDTTALFAALGGGWWGLGGEYYSRSLSAGQR
ncbi:MAG TPA: efflux transporter outer membrane subunit [Syntrophobacteraceae bacterium]|nr:efflux transporter outer membrane subunit [Syntrophobacteraceae bacterium]